MVELLREQQLEYLIAASEGQTLEWKSSRIHPHDLATTLIAFANADGGRLLIGIEDDGTLHGGTGLWGGPHLPRDGGCRRASWTSPDEKCIYGKKLAHI